MLQNIWEQPKGVADCLAIGFPLSDRVLSAQHIMLLACSSSRQDGLADQYWLETIAKIPVQVPAAAAWTDRTAAIKIPKIRSS